MVCQVWRSSGALGALVVVGLIGLTGCVDDGGTASPAVPSVSARPGEEADDPSPASALDPVAGPASGVAVSPADVAPPSSPSEAAARITVIERALRDPGTPADEVPALGWEQQVVYRTLAGDDAWLADVLASVPDDVALVVAANTGGGSAISSLVEPPEHLPTSWRIVTPPAPEELVSHYREAEVMSGVPWQYLAAINLVETRMGRIVGDSSAGAQGPMQFIPSTWEAFGAGGDVEDPRDAILAAGRYLAASGAPDDIDAALLAYNRSEAYVDAVKRYASAIEADPRAYLGYYHWQVTYRTVDGLHLLPEGYPEVPAVRLG